MTELRLTRVIDRIETLKDAGKWSFRQPKKQRAVDNINKTHWDYLLDEMVRSYHLVRFFSQRLPDRNGCASILGKNESGR